MKPDDRFILSDKDYEEWKQGLERAEEIKKEAKKEARCDNKTNKLSEIITRKNHEKMKNYFIEKNNERDERRGCN